MRTNTEYLARNAATTAGGIGSPGMERRRAAMQSQAAFLRSCVQQWAAGREEPQGSPVLHRYFRLPFRSPTQSEVGLAV